MILSVFGLAVWHALALETRRKSSQINVATDQSPPEHSGVHSRLGSILGSQVFGRTSGPLTRPEPGSVQTKLEPQKPGRSIDLDNPNESGSETRAYQLVGSLSSFTVTQDLIQAVASILAISPAELVLFFRSLNLGKAWYDARGIFRVPWKVRFILVDSPSNQMTDTLANLNLFSQGHFIIPLVPECAVLDPRTDIPSGLLKELKRRIAKSSTMTGFSVVKILNRFDLHDSQRDSVNSKWPWYDPEANQFTLFAKPLVIPKAIGEFLKDNIVLPSILLNFGGVYGLLRYLYITVADSNSIYNQQDVDQATLDIAELLKGSPIETSVFTELNGLLSEFYKPMEFEKPETRAESPIVDNPNGQVLSVVGTPHPFTITKDLVRVVATWLKVTPEQLLYDIKSLDLGGDWYDRDGVFRIPLRVKTLLFPCVLNEEMRKSLEKLNLYYKGNLKIPLPPQWIVTLWPFDVPFGLRKTIYERLSKSKRLGRIGKASIRTLLGAFGRTTPSTRDKSWPWYDGSQPNGFKLFVSGLRVPKSLNELVKDVQFTGILSNIFPTPKLALKDLGFVETDDTESEAELLKAAQVAFDRLPEGRPVTNVEDQEVNSEIDHIIRSLPAN